jgi:nucleotide-binding universal stress UspA family protein
MKLLVPVSGSNSSLAAVRHAAAALAGRSGEVVLVNVQPLIPAYAARFSSRASRDALRSDRSNAAFARAGAILEAAGVRFQKVATTGHIPEAVAEVARRVGADEIVLGTTRQPGWWQALFSPVPDILDQADIPVAVVGAGRAGRLERYGIPACIGLGFTALMMATE